MTEQMRASIEALLVACEQIDPNNQHGCHCGLCESERDDIADAAHDLRALLAENPAPGGSS